MEVYSLLYQRGSESVKVLETNVKVNNIKAIKKLSTFIQPKSMKDRFSAWNRGQLGGYVLNAFVFFLVYDSKSTSSHWFALYTVTVKCS